MFEGLRFGRYVVGERIGRGGFGVVHLGRDSELGRDVAIKFLRPEYLTREQVVQRFLQEARATATIGHPGIVTVFECGVVTGTGERADGTAYIVMERLQGESLAARIEDKGRFPIAAAIAIGRQLAAALGAAHDASIIHRDLKPDNVFLLPDAAVVGGERAKILDFGIAKLADPGAGGVHTHSQMILGTPRYMSPEQARSAAKVDVRSDIYALGCMFYELVCGRPPFTGNTGDVLIHHQSTPAVPPHDVVDGLPPALDRLIVDMLEKEPDRRPQTMKAVDEALAAIAPATPLAPVVATPRAATPKPIREVTTTTLAEPPVAGDASAVTARRDPLPAPPGLPMFGEPPTLAARTLATVRNRWYLIAGIVAVLFVGTVAIVMLGQRDDVPVAASPGTEPAPPSPPPALAPVGSDDEANAEAATDNGEPNASSDVTTIETRCAELLDKRRWPELGNCGHELEALDLDRGRDWIERATREAKAEVALRHEKTALERGDLAAASREFREITSGSIYYLEALRAFDPLTETAVASLDVLARKHACDKYEAMLRTLETRLELPVFESIQERARGCGSKTRVATAPKASSSDDVVEVSSCENAAGIEASADADNASGRYAAALHGYEQIMACKNVKQKAYLAACKSRQFLKARNYFRGLPKSYAQICLNQGFDPRAVAP